MNAESVSGYRGWQRVRSTLAATLTTLVVGLAVLTLTACARTPVQAHATSVAVSWIGDCNLAAPKTFYSIALSADGKARFTGVQAVKAQGTENVDVNVAADRARTLMNNLRAAVSRGAASSEVGRDCLAIEQEGKRVLLSIKDPQVRELHAFVKQSSALRRLICPAHRNVPMRDEYCAQPLISLRYQAQASCRFQHTTELYADGTAHYYVLGPGPAQADQYGHVDLSFIRNLEQEIGSKPQQIAGMPVYKFDGAAAELLRGRLQKTTFQDWYDRFPADATYGGADDRLVYPIMNVAFAN